jgi:hypothetical protein
VNKRKSDASLAMSTSLRENSIISGALCALAAVASMYPMQLSGCGHERVFYNLGTVDGGGEGR